MAMGDYLSNMFLGTAYGGGEDAGSQKASQELWKIYQQAYNVKPVWNGKSWVMPPGAIQRFQMLLPLIQAQMKSGQAGGKGAEGNYGLAGGLVQGLGKSLYTGLGKKIGGWEGVLDKLGGGIKGLWDSATGSPTTPDFNSPDNQGEDWWSNQPQDSNINMPTVDPNVNEDWWSNGPDTTSMDWLDSIDTDPTSYYDFTENFW